IPLPVARVDAWKDVVRPLRQARDYMRFLGPGYGHAAKLAQRAGQYAPPGWAARFDRRPWLRRHADWVRRGLELAEAVVPSERFYELSMRPSGSREVFCQEAGLDPGRPLLLYLCSSKFVAPREVEFVRGWIDAVRRSSDPCLRRAAVLVRPHPANAEQWAGVTLSDFD